MVIRTFIDKCTTIFQKSEDNFGLNPVLMLNHGMNNSRGLIQFDVQKIKQLSDEGTFGDKSLLKHTLKMYNCGSIDMRRIDQKLTWNVVTEDTFRAASFTLIAFKVPKDWDDGRGFDNSTDMWFTGRAAVSKQGCTWYNSDSAHKWLNEGIYPYFEIQPNATGNDKEYPNYNVNGNGNVVIGDGVFEDEDVANYTINQEYIKFLNGEDSIIVAAQHFDYGNEDLLLDLTDYINSLVEGKINNHGLCICFSPDDVLNDSKLKNKTYYTGFFTNHTNTFFEPYVETRYDNTIYDSRNDFHLGLNNKLYFYVNDSDGSINLDELPVCTIDGTSYEVTRQGVGVYYATVKLNKNDYESDTILTDVWSNIKINGEELDDVKMEFVAKSYESAVTIGKNKKFESTPLVVVSGIKDDEKVNQGDVRTVYVTVKVPYSGMNRCKQEKMQYRLYVHDAYRQTDVIDWDGINVTPEGNYFTIDTSGLLPAEYHVDVKLGKKIFENRLTFKVVNNSSNEKK